MICEAAWVLRPGGLFAVADIVQTQELAPEARAAMDQWAACVSGSIPVDEYRSSLENAGFTDVDIDVYSEQELEGQGRIGNAYIGRAGHRSQPGRGLVAGRDGEPVLPHSRARRKPGLPRTGAVLLKGCAECRQSVHCVNPRSRTSCKALAVGPARQVNRRDRASE